MTLRLIIWFIFRVESIWLTETCLLLMSLRCMLPLICFPSIVPSQGITNALSSQLSVSSRLFTVMHNCWSASGDGWGLFDKTACPEQNNTGNTDRITQIVFSTYVVLTELYLIFFLYPLLLFFSNIQPHCISPEREQWIFLCVENRRGLRSFSLAPICC